MSTDTLNFNIKHAGKVYPITLEGSATAGDLKNKVENLVKVPASRQKYMVKGGLNNDSTSNLSSIIKEGSTIMLLGTADESLIAKPKKQHKFIEDLAPEQQFHHVNQLPIGFQNMGNTCYMNATLQALYRIEPLRSLVLAYNPSDDTSGRPVDEKHVKIIVGMKRCFEGLKNKNYESVLPMVLLTALRKCYPQFAERDNQSGLYKQQDAEELFTQLFQTMSVVFGDKFSDDFNIRFRTTIKDTNNEDDIKISEDEHDVKLQCHISGTTNFLKNGLLESLHDKLEKRSEITGINSTYSVDKQINRLPEYLTVQYVRFFWKRSAGKKSKILRKVVFPFQLDVSDMLTPEYAKAKIQLRDDFRQIDKERIEKENDNKKRKLNLEDDADTSVMTPRERHETELALIQSEKEHWRQEFKKKTPQDLEPGENPSCLYELVGVITHQGANSESGHYQSFIRDDIDENKWYNFNDDKVNVVSKEKIETLAGGGESDSALILLFKGFGL